MTDFNEERAKIRQRQLEEFEKHQRAAEYGEAEGQYQLGMAYKGSSFVESNIDQALYWLEHAAAQEHDKAQHELGMIYLEGLRGVKKNQVLARQWLEKAAEKNHLDSIINLAVCFANGFGGEQSHEKAFKLFLKAAEAGHAYAQDCLGDCYWQGRGVDKDIDQSFNWTVLAAKQGILRSQERMGRGCFAVQEYEKAAYWYLKAGQQGSLMAKQMLSKMYSEGLGVKQDLGIAGRFLQGAADQYYWKCRKHWDAMYEEAFSYLQAAADEGDVIAQYHLGYAYDKGRGVDRYPKKAAEWYTRSAENEYAEAQYMLGVLYSRGRGVKKNLETSFRWMKKAAMQGHKKAQSSVGTAYALGNGVDRDLKKAEFWSSMSRRKGSGNEDQ